MNLIEIHKAIKRVIKRHAVAFRTISSSQTALLEIASITGIVEHYKSLGCVLTVINPKGKRGFVVKTSTRGHPWNFSYFQSTLAGQDFEIHMNLMVRSAHDPGVYCVDVGLVKAGSVPKKATLEKWVCVDNSEIITFAETKKLVVYPMLLAQFIGIVHEILPGYLKVSFTAGTGALVHLPPMLISIGYYSGNSKNIVSAYKSRSIDVFIADSYDIRLARVRGGTVNTPFFY